MVMHEGYNFQMLKVSKPNEKLSSTSFVLKFWLGFKMVLF